MSGRQIRLLLTIFILAVGVANSLSPAQAAPAALFFLGFIFIVVWWGYFPKRLLVGLVLVVLVGGLVSFSVPRDPEVPQSFITRVTADTASTTYGSVTSVALERGQLKVWAERYPRFEVGDIVLVEVTGVSQEFKGFANGKIELRERPEVFSATGFLSGLRRGFLDLTRYLLPEPHSVFAAGTVVGGSAGLPATLKDKFSAAGISHILAASGYNFALLLVFLSFVFRSFSVRLQTLLFLVVIPAFAVIAGATPAVLRAALMGSLVCLGVASGRVANVKTVLLWAGALLLIHDPGLISHDLGFQLSFLATLGIVWLNPLFEKLLKFTFDNDYQPSVKVKIARVVAEGSVTTLAAQIATLPLLSYSFGVISVTSLLANVLVAPVIPLIMISTSLACLVGLVNPLAGQLIGLLPWFLTSYIFKIADLLGSSSWSQADLRFSGTWLWVFYTVLATVIMVLHRFYLRHKYPVEW